MARIMYAGPEVLLAPEYRTSSQCVDRILDSGAESMRENIEQNARSVFGAWYATGYLGFMSVGTANAVRRDATMTESTLAVAMLASFAALPFTLARILCAVLRFTR